eukprot:1985141-Pyramimonas_sp.AAC.1
MAKGAARGARDVSLPPGLRPGGDTPAHCPQHFESSPATGCRARSAASRRLSARTRRPAGR